MTQVRTEVAPGGCEHWERAGAGLGDAEMGLLLDRVVVAQMHTRVSGQEAAHVRLCLHALPCM